MEVIVYEKTYVYAGDFKDDIAVVREKEGKCTHIYQDGELVHGKRYLDLGVYHKGFALARDKHGWFHINPRGWMVYPTRFKQLEPFYNGFAIATTLKGKRIIIDELGVFAFELK